MLHKAYHDRNKSVQQFANSLTVKTVNGQKWIFNPLNNFWLFLSAQKDSFSAVNQNSATYILDMWLKYIRERGIVINYQCHDEWLRRCLLTEVENTYKIAKEEYIKVVADKYKNKITEQCYQALYNYQVEITD